MAEKKGLIYKFIVGSDKDENYARSTLPSNRWELFKDILKGRFWKLVLINLMAIIALIPAALIILMKQANISAAGFLMPFSGSMFIGEPYIPGLAQFAVTTRMTIGFQTSVMLIPCLIFAGIILSGLFYIARNLVWSEAVFIANDFWKGLKSNILYFMLITFLYGIALLALNTNISILGEPSLMNSAFLTQPVVNSILRGLSYVFFGFITIMVFFAFTITVTYKVKFRQLIKNSFILTLGLLPKNIFFLLLAFIPEILIVLFPGGMLTGLFLGVVLLLGLSCAIIVWSIYSHYIFDTYLNDKVEGAVKNRGLYQKMSKEGKPVNKKSWFENPKKKKIKPVTDEEVKITELPTNFSRADLAKLAAEKEALKEDSENWAKEHENDDGEESEGDDGDDSAFEGYEDAMKLEGYEEGDTAGEETEEKPSKKDKTDNK